MTLFGWRWLCLHLSSGIIQNTWTMLPGCVYRATEGRWLIYTFLFGVVLPVTGLTRFVLLLSKPIDLMASQFKHFKSCQLLQLYM